MIVKRQYINPQYCDEHGLAGGLISSSVGKNVSGGGEIFRRNVAGFSHCSDGATSVWSDGYPGDGGMFEADP